jgi:hypothetical protein
VANEESELVLNVRLSGDFVIDVIEESLIRGVPEEEIVFRALLIYAQLIRYVDDSHKITLSEVSDAESRYIQTDVVDKRSGNIRRRHRIAKWPPYPGHDY